MTDKLRNRTKVFALRIIRLVETLPHTRAGSDAEWLLIEANEIVAMTVASINTAKRGAGRTS